MANFVSIQTGDWNDGGTYGKTSPGVKGTDWPGLTGDTVTVAAGHTVIYNVSETNELGQIDLVGKLAFDNNVAARKLTLGHQNLNVSATGELEIGTSASNFNKAYNAEILWNTTYDNAKGLIIANGGKLTVYGDSTYCSNYEDTLANDAENTDGDTSIKTVTDMSSIWHVGDEITIKVENAGDSTSHQDAIKKGVIQSFAGTTIVLDINVMAAAGVGNTWISPVINVTRNVQFGKLNADTACGDGYNHYNNYRPKFVDTNASGNNNCFFSYAMVTGIYSINSDYDFQFLHSIIRNCYYGFTHGAGHTISGNIYSNYHGFYYGAGHTISGSVYSNFYGFMKGLGHTMSGNIYSNYYSFYYGTSHTMSGNIYSNCYGFRYAIGYTVLGNIYCNDYGFSCDTAFTISGRIGYDESDVTAPNITSDILVRGYDKYVLLNVKLPLAGLNVNRNIDKYITRIVCEHHNRIINTYKIYDNNGDILKTACDGTGDAPSQDPDGGSGDCLELSNIQSLCNSGNPLIAILPREYRIWATTGVAKTYTFKVQTTYAGIAAGNLKLTAKYLDEVSGGHLGEQINAPAIDTRGTAADWTQILAVTVTPAQTGWVSFEIKLMEYEANNEVYIWPATVIT